LTGCGLNRYFAAVNNAGLYTLPDDALNKGKWGQGLICDHIITDQALTPFLVAKCN